ncbi:hypothetical protein T492DRAFT_1108664 [Pavlovales sp. CCMP2436]|nr:hypothetical protein T492DRAFT_1108664 [Pavlovales sp. CCMP2436]|mmetsp:Transcript_13414/g.34200  ORF Transcript_13414/g.34200 Transcript_13414/m.34200 type:complete len:301 (-) Transcript_13414:88-990(-)
MASCTTIGAAGVYATAVGAARLRMAADAAWLATLAHRAAFVDPALVSRPSGEPGGLPPTSWADYWQWRGWNAHAAGALGPGAAHAPFRRQLSAMLTFPMTLAHVLARPRFGFASTERSLDIVLLGARAEGSLPPSAWAELTHAVPALRGLQLRMVGPMVDTKLATGSSREVWSAHGMRTSIHRGYYHELLADTEQAQLLAAPDAFVLFHPGLSHVGWACAWTPTMRRVLATGVPVLITGFSQEDSRANLRFVESLCSQSGGRRCGKLWTNPFASIQTVIDEGAGAAAMPLMRANHSFFVL